jgi:hypothetical protein
MIGVGHSLPTTQISLRDSSSTWQSRPSTSSRAEVSSADRVAVMAITAHRQEQQVMQLSANDVERDTFDEGIDTPSVDAVSADDLRKFEEYLAAADKSIDEPMADFIETNKGTGLPSQSIDSDQAIETNEKPEQRLDDSGVVPVAHAVASATADLKRDVYLIMAEVARSRMKLRQVINELVMNSRQISSDVLSLALQQNINPRINRVEVYV